MILHVHRWLMTNEDLLQGNRESWAGGAEGDRTEEIKESRGNLQMGNKSIHLPFQHFNHSWSQKALSWFLAVSSYVSLPLLL